MASSPVISNPVTNNTNGPRDSSKRRNKKKMQLQSSCSRDQVTQNLNNNGGSNHNQISSWKSDGRQEEYRSKLVQVIRQVRLGSGTSPHPESASLRGRAVREAADRVLAMTAKGRTRWSRAIVTNKLKHKLMKSNLKQRGVVATVTGNRRLKKQSAGILRLKSKNLPAVQRKIRHLGRLVPGCRKLPLPVVLEEAMDYIAALEMQVKAMTALANLVSGGSNSSFGAGAAIGQIGFSQPPPS